MRWRSRLRSGSRDERRMRHRRSNACHACRMTQESQLYCEGGPYDGNVYPSDGVHGGKLVFESGRFSPRDKPFAVYRATDRQVTTEQGAARVFEYDVTASQPGHD
jgi:hypothetical protein